MVAIQVGRWRRATGARVNKLVLDINFPRPRSHFEIIVVIFLRNDANPEPRFSRPVLNLGFLISSGAPSNRLPVPGDRLHWSACPGKILDDVK